MHRSHPFDLPHHENRTRVNDMIRIPEIRLVGEDGQQIGVVPTHVARQMAQEKGLDLVEVAPMARPPVCRIMDFGKYRFEEAKKDKVSKAKQHVVKVKEIKFHPRTDTNDYDYRLEHAKEFLDKGFKVKASVFFRGRELAHMDYGRRLLDQMVRDLDEIAIVEQMPSLEGKSLSLVLSPAKKKKLEKTDKPEKAEKPERAEKPQAPVASKPASESPKRGTEPVPAGVSEEAQ